jgi:hypothetical protein
MKSFRLTFGAREGGDGMPEQGEKPLRLAFERGRGYGWARGVVEMMKPLCLAFGAREGAMGCWNRAKSPSGSRSSEGGAGTRNGGGWV